MFRSLCSAPVENGIRFWSLIPLAATNRHRPSREIDILDPQPNTLHQPHAGAVEQPGHQPVCPLHVNQHAFHFVTGENRQQSFWPLRTLECTKFASVATHHDRIQEYGGVERLISRG